MRIHMNRLGKLIGLVAVCATAAFLTGCDDDDNDNPSNFAPDSLNGRAFTLGSSIAFGSNDNNYLLDLDGATETGTFSGDRNGDVWNVTLVRSLGDITSHLVMTFTGSGVGTYTLDKPGQTLIAGSFTEIGTGTTTSTGTSTSTGTDTGTSTSTGTTTSTGTSTSTGTDTGTSTSTGTTTGTGTVPAPATLGFIHVTTAQSGIGSNSIYNVTFNGGTSGTFQATNVEGNSTGSGTFEYTPQGNQAHLRMNYDQPAGDFDDMTLIFTTAPGGGANQFTGTQKVTGTDYAFTGTFTY
jgi:hypothetical protein